VFPKIRNAIIHFLQWLQYEIWFFKCYLTVLHNLYDTSRLICKIGRHTCELMSGSGTGGSEFGFLTWCPPWGPCIWEFGVWLCPSGPEVGSEIPWRIPFTLLPTPPPTLTLPSNCPLDLPLTSSGGLLPPPVELKQFPILQLLLMLSCRLHYLFPLTTHTFTYSF